MKHLSNVRRRSRDAAVVREVGSDVSVAQCRSVGVPPWTGEVAREVSVLGGQCSSGGPACDESARDLQGAEILISDVPTSYAVDYQHFSVGSSASDVLSEMAGFTHHRGRSRFRNAATWECSVRKRLRNSGMPYVSRNGATRRQKLLKPGCGRKCHQRCHDRISDEQREKIFNSFWQLGNLDQQRQFLLSHVSRSGEA